MALIKEKQLFGGQVSGEYWKIIQVHVDVLKLEVAMDMGLYKNKESADAQLPLLDKKHLVFKAEKADLSDDLRAWAYGKVKIYVNQETVIGKDETGNDIKKIGDEDLSDAKDS